MAGSNEHPEQLMALEGDGMGAALPVPIGSTKEVGENSKAEGKQVLVVDMTGARKSSQCFLAFGFFLSVLLVNSRQLIDHMKKVWKIRGEMDDNPLEAETARKFILQFSQERDWRHAILGGPWQYKGDAFLVEGLAAGADPSSALFTHVPIWVQFRNIPFYLLTKKLAHDLKEIIGSTMKINNNARGYINDKFIRTRFQLPLIMPLQKITLLDEITGDEVLVQIRYERLPNFCLFYGFIGHMEARCDIPVAEKRLNFFLSLRVPSVHCDDPRCWFLPDRMGQSSHKPHASSLWCAPKPTNAGLPEDVELVLKKVARMSVTDHNLQGNDRKLVGEFCGENKGSGTQDKDQQVDAFNLDETNSSGSTSVKKRKGWKRRERDGSVVQRNTVVNTSPEKQGKQGGNGGRPRLDVADDGDMEPSLKKSFFQGPTLSECFGREGVLFLKAAEQHEPSNADENRIAGDEPRDTSNSLKDVEGGKEATGPGATGNLSGANVSARQEP